METKCVQEFRLEFKCNEDNSVVIIREWLHSCLGALMDVDGGGFVAHTFGSFSYGQVVTGSLFIGSSDNVTEDQLRETLTRSNEKLELLRVRKL